ncbi:MAG TPA: lactate utilization protein [Pyrinomonadaceae bacterium]
MVAASDTKSAMLAKIRDNLRTSEAFEHLYPHLAPAAIPTQPVRAVIETRELAVRFKTELENIGGECHITANEADAIARIRGVLRDIGAATIAISDHPFLHLLRGSMDEIELIENPSRADLFNRVDAGITGTQLAIAETGTLVLRSSSEAHRLVSLVPPVHICLVSAADIVPTMFEALDELKDVVDPAITFVTGPSRTSDIELTLAIGVHGPKRLIVTLIDRI